MVRRSLGVALWAIVGLLACGLGVHRGLTGTAEGRSFLAAMVRGFLNRALAGSVEIAELGGTLVTGVWLRDVRLYDSHGTPIAEVPRIDVGYNPFDLSPGRIVVGPVRLERPDVQIVEHAGGRLNVEELVRARTGPRSGRPAALVQFRDVTITDGSLIVALLDRPSPDDSAHEIERHPADGRRRVRRFAGLDARLASLRVSSPRERGVRVNITELAVTASDPPIAVREVGGRVTVVGDSVVVGLGHVSLPRSAFALAGTVSWPRDTVLFDLDATVDSVTLTDLRFIDERFAPGARFRGSARVRSRTGRDLSVTLDPLDLRHAGGRVRGRLAVVSRAGAGLAVVEGADLDAERFDLEFARPYLDTLPFAGRVSGHAVAVGAIEALALDVDMVFVDSLVPGWPATHVRGRGEVGVGAEAGLVFRDFEATAATVDLGTVRRLVPAVSLNGVVEASGLLNGSPRDAEFVGTLRHRDGERAPSEARGRFRLDARRDTVVLDVDATVAPLALAGLQGSYPGLGLDAPLSGTVQLSGPMDSLAARVDVTAAERGGSVRAEGLLTLLADRRGARDLTIHGTDVDLSRWAAGAPDSRLSFDARLDVDADSAAIRSGALSLGLGPSMFVGTPLDSGTARLRVAEGRIEVDTLALVQPGLRTTARGALGIAAPAGGELRVSLEADSLGPLDSLVLWATRNAVAIPDTGAPLQGAGSVSMTLGGALDSLTVRAEGEVPELRWRTWYVRAAEGEFALQRASAPRFTIAGAVDSVAAGRLGFGGSSWRVAGHADSLTWFARSRIGDLAAFLGGGRAMRDSTGRHVAVDSLAVLAAGSVWVLEQPVMAVVSDSSARVSPGVLRDVWGDGRVGFGGDLPVAGEANARIELVHMPLAGLVGLLQFDTSGVGGTLDGTMTLTGTRRAPVVDGRVTLRDGSFGEFRAASVEAQTAYRDRRLEVTGSVQRENVRLVNVTARLPLDLALTHVDRRRLAEPLSIRITADAVDLSAAAILTETLADLQGVVSADVGVLGTWEQPELSGSLEMRDAAARIPAMNVRYHGILGRFSLRGDTILVDTLTLRSGTGSAVVRGHLRLVNLTRPVMALSISANRFAAVDLKNQLSATVSGRLRLEGQVFGATLSGQGMVTEGVWYFRDAVAKRVVNLDEPWVRALIDTTFLDEGRVRSSFRSRFLDSLRIRGLELRMGESVWLRSTEANVQLRDTLLVDKERQNYRLRGTLRAERGTYRLVVGPVTREFTVTDGTVRYFGTPDLDAALDINARHVVNPVPLPGRETAEQVTVLAHIGGTLIVPRLTLRAEEREMPQAEVISYLMFGIPNVGAAVEGGSGSTQRYLVQSAASSLVTGELSRVLISDLGVPLDYVEIRPGSPEDPISGALFAAGWQIGPRTFLIVNAGFCQGRPVSLNNTFGASLQYRFDQSWRTEASFEPVRTCAAPAVEAQAQSVVRQLGLDLLWEKRF
jgi:hypothetical protein